jgi:hypothetical protein
MKNLVIFKMKKNLVIQKKNENYSIGTCQIRRRLSSSVKSGTVHTHTDIQTSKILAKNVVMFLVTFMVTVTVNSFY